VAFTAGLLHDIGKSIMSHYLDGMTHNISERIDRGEVVDYLTAEREAFGIGHPGIGREMARAWGLPTVLEHVIGEHHRPSEAAPEYRSLVFAVHIGDIMAMMAGAATGADAMSYVLDAHWVDYYDMSQEQFEKMFLVVEQEFEKTRQAVFGAADG
jgi:putative nucleotidyltransferase with HDIG domain